METKRRAASPGWKGVLGVSVVVAVLAAGCGGKTIDVEGSAVPVSRFTKAVGAVCRARLHARTDAGSARRIYRRDADGAIQLAVRALGPKRQIVAQNLERARTKVAADLAGTPPAPILFADLGLLAESARAGLARLAIETSPCKT